MTTDGRAGRGVPADRRLHRSGQRHPGDRHGCARCANAQICEHTEVTSITVDGRRAPTVHTRPGRHRRCEMVVNAAGMWGMEIGRMAGVRVPAVAVEHQYVLTGPIADFTPAELGQMPTMRDPDHLVYYKPDGPGLLVGGYEPDTLPFGRRRASRRRSNVSCSTRTSTASSSSPTLAAKRTPVHRAGRHPHADQRADPVLGRRRLRDGQGARARQLLRRHRLPLRHRRRRRRRQDDGRVDPRGPPVARPVAARRAPVRVPPHDASLHGLAHGRAVRPPLQARRTGYRARHVARGVRRSPLHDTLAAQGAVFGSRGGWERPNWFAPPGVGAGRPSVVRRAELVRRTSPREHRAVRERCRA